MLYSDNSSSGFSITINQGYNEGTYIGDITGLAEVDDLQINTGFGNLYNINI